MSKFRAKIDGTPKLQQAFRRLPTIVLQAAMRGLAKASIEILNDAKARLSEGGSRVTGLLFNSGKVTESEEESNAYDIGFDADYAAFVEFGRRPGKMPPVDHIKEWVKKRHIADTYSIKTHRQIKRNEDFDKRAENIAWAIAKSIEKQGTKAHPFLFPAFEEKKGNAEKHIRSEIEKVLNQMR